VLGDADTQDMPTGAGGAEIRSTDWSEEGYASLFANLPGAAYRCSISTAREMEYMSPEVERVCGYPASEFVGQGGKVPARSFASVIHADDRVMVERAIGRAVERREAFDLEYRVTHANGDVRWVHERGRTIVDPSGAALYLVGAIFDSTAHL
jgi:PAS domain S-box-containing protein